jgi:hypothetical protein
MDCRQSLSRRYFNSRPPNKVDPLFFLKIQICHIFTGSFLPNKKSNQPPSRPLISSPPSPSTFVGGKRSLLINHVIHQHAISHQSTPSAFSSSFLLTNSFQYFSFHLLHLHHLLLPHLLHMQSQKAVAVPAMLNM